MKKAFVITNLVFVMLIIIGCGVAAPETLKIVESEQPAAVDETPKTDETPSAENIFNAGIVVGFEKVDHSLIGESGLVLGEYYYEKPVLLGDSEAVSKINAFFEEECNGFFYGENRLNFYSDDSRNRFYMYIDQRLDIHGEDPDWFPSWYLVDSEIAYMDGKTISIRNMKYWLATGVNSVFYYGATFDLETGELLPIEYFIDMDMGEFRKQIEEYLCNGFVNEWGYGEYIIDDVIASVDYWEENGKEYFYDGSSVYVVFLKWPTQSSGSYIRWDIAAGEVNPNVEINDFYVKRERPRYVSTYKPSSD